MESKNNGMGFLSWLTLMFVAAKLLGLINWSWWLVFAPVWVSIIVVLIILVWACLQDK